MKKNKILKAVSILLCFTLLTGCNSNDKSYSEYDVEHEEKDEVETYITETAVETTTTLLETTTTTTEPVPEFPKNYGITDCTGFSEGIAFIETEGGRKYAIDSEGSIVFEFSSKFDDKELPTEGLCNGYFVYDCINYSFKNGNPAKYIINNKGKVLMDGGGDDADFDTIIKLRSYESTSHISEDGYCLAYKLEKKISGDVLSLGVIKDGEWLIPLRSDYKMVEIFSEYPPETLYYLGENVIHYKGYSYNFVTDEIIAEGIDNQLFYKNGFIVAGDDDHYFIYDEKTKTKKEFIKEEDYRIRDFKIINGALISVCYSYQYNVIYDLEGNELINTKDYGFVHHTGRTLHKDGYTFIEGTSVNTNDNYIVVFNEKNELAFEPIYVECCDFVYFENGIITIIDNLYANTITQYNTTGELINTMYDIPYGTTFSPKENLFFGWRDNSTYSKYTYINMEGEIVIK